jgi:deazaflavin-dependent oxidoreductase (nitroreductase family)
VADDFCYLSTTGRRSGRTHEIEIWFATVPPDESTLYLLSGGGLASDWVANLIADPHCGVRIGSRGAAVHAALGRVVADPDEIERAKDAVVAKYEPGYDGGLADWRSRSVAVALDLES